jgi:predicted peroxiredoxin
VASDDKVVIGLTTGLDDPERVLLWLTKDAVHVATEGFAAQVVVPDAPSVADLHAEYVEKGGIFYACPVCVKTRGMQEASWVPGAEVKGAPAVYEFTEGGALTFTY